MRKLHNGMVFVLSLYSSLVLLAGCATIHPVIFINQACIKPYKRYDYLTCARMRVKIDGKKYVIPKNFKTDLASIPRPLWPIFAPQYSGFVAPAILHDYLYRCDHTNNRRFADDVLYSALIADGVSRFTASKFYIAVRLFGWAHYKLEKTYC